MEMNDKMDANIKEEEEEEKKIITTNINKEEEDNNINIINDKKDNDNVTTANDNKITKNYLEFGDKSHQFQCDICGKDITRLLRIQCAECIDFDLCLDCFCHGSEKENHKKDHKYQISDCLSTLYIINKNIDKEKDKDKDKYKDMWSAEEELLLLDGIEMFGMGNWKDVAEHIGTNKNDKKCEQHYIDFYINSGSNNLPDIHFYGDNDNENNINSYISSNNRQSKISNNKNELKSNKINHSNSRTSLKGSQLNRVIGSDIAGYMPLRGDFDIEFDNDAEQILADMEFSENDHPSEIQLKLEIINIYNKTLDERARRKKFVIERGLLDYKKQHMLEKKKKKEERELIASLRPFARFHSKEEHEEFVENMIKAMNLRKTISKYQHYRSLGITTLAKAQEYEESIRQKQINSTIDNKDSVDSIDSSKKSYDIEPDEIIDICDASGGELLAENEKELCRSLELLPKHYLVIKNIIITESLRYGKLNEDKMKQMLKFGTEEKKGRIFDFFVTLGYASESIESSKLNQEINRAQCDTTKKNLTSTESTDKTVESSIHLKRKLSDQSIIRKNETLEQPCLNPEADLELSHRKKKKRMDDPLISL